MAHAASAVKQGRIIVIEGASDGIGKTTQYKALVEHLQADGIKICRHHFPTYYSYQGKSVEMYLSGAYGQLTDLSPYFINSLYAHDRAVSWYTKLKTAYEKGQTLVLDRYTTSSLLYQSSMIDNPVTKKQFLDYVDDFEYNKLGIGRPDLVIFLYAPLDTINKIRSERKENEGIQGDIHERNLDYLKKVYDNGHFVADYFGWKFINCATPAGTKFRSVDSIHQDVYRAVKSVLKSK